MSTRWRWSFELFPTLPYEMQVRKRLRTAVTGRRDDTHTLLRLNDVPTQDIAVQVSVNRPALYRKMIEPAGTRVC